MRIKNALRNRTVQLVLCIVVFVIALGITVYPVVSSFIAEKYRSSALSDYNEEMENLDNTKIEDARKEAEAYNQALRDRHINPGEEAMMLNKPEEGYDDVLNLQNNGLMGFIKIPVLDQELPIYHGLDGETLDVGVGHMPGSSLPIGGPNTHAILAGHSALASQPLFSDLDKVKEGDHFTIEILNENLEYVIDDIRVVLPEDVSGLQPVDGEDYVTLVTCTPYGVNTHRLLVRGKRTTEVLKESDIIQISKEEKPASSWQTQYEHGLELGLCLVLLLIIVPVLIYFIVKRIRKPKSRGRHTKL